MLHRDRIPRIRLLDHALGDVSALVLQRFNAANNFKDALDFFFEDADDEGFIDDGGDDNGEE